MADTPASLAALLNGLATTVTGHIATLTADAASLVALATRVGALVAGSGGGTSPDGTVSTPAAPVTLTDKNGLVWTFLAAANQYGNNLAINGAASAYFGVNMVMAGGLIKSKDGTGGWWLLTNATTYASTTPPAGF